MRWFGMSKYERKLGSMYLFMRLRMAQTTGISIREAKSGMIVH